jgi:hypothetical protein
MRRVVLIVLVAALLLAGTPAAPVRAGDRPPYTGTIEPLPGGIRRWMNGVSWRPGCPVPLRDLRLLRLRYWGFDRTAHRGRLVVHRDVAWKMVGIFRRLYQVSFPIRRMRLVDYY